MYDFHKILSALIKREGFYDNDPDDTGGETIYGITRRNDPDFTGWALVDKEKETGGVLSLQNSVALLADVADHYYHKYWSVNSLDEIAAINSDIAEKIFDAGVNCGTRRAAQWFQRALNVYDRSETRYADIKVDGSIGEKTINALMLASIYPHYDTVILRLINGIQIVHYIGCAERREISEKYIDGWLLNRAVERFK